MVELGYVGNAALVVPGARAHVGRLGCASVACAPAAMPRHNRSRIVRSRDRAAWVARAAIEDGGAAGAGTKDMMALIFDCDGVLAETEKEAHRTAFNEAFAERGLDTDWTPELYGELLATGGGKERMTAHWNRVGWPAAAPSDEDGRKELVKALHKRKTELFMELIGTGRVPLRGGVERLVDEALARGLTVAVCSTSNELAVGRIVALLGEQRAARISIFAGDIVARKKPSPDIYLLALDKLQLDASRCVVVEDSHIGLSAAKDAGIACVITKSFYTSDEDFSRADAVFSDLDADSVSLDTLAALL